MKTLNAEKGLALPAGSGSPLESLANPENSVLPLSTETQGKFPPSVAPSDPVMTDDNHLSITPAVEAGPVPEGPGYAELWLWFGLSRASWLAIPRVLMHEMPDQWQADMARLLWQFGDEFPNMEPSHTAIMAKGKNGKLAKLPDGVNDYRRPKAHYIEACRTTPQTEEEKS